MPEHAETETEIKLRLPEAAVAALESHPVLRPPQASAARTRSERSTYFDTPDFQLAREGLVLRIRRVNDKFVQTVKSKAGGHDGFGRGEWEAGVKGDSPDPAQFAGTPLATLPEAVIARLAPVFATEIRRTRRTVRLPGGTEVEAALDQGEIVAGDSREPVREFELELKSGQAASLFQLGREMQADLSLTLGPDTKAARGYRLRSGELPLAEKAPALSVPADADAAAALASMFGNALHHLLGNQSAAETGVVEGVHQMRAALRRLRSLLVLFRDRLDPAAVAGFTDRVREVGHVLGAARDWDVFCTETLPAAVVAADGDDGRLAALRGLVPASEQRRRAAQDAVRAMLQGPDFSGLVLELAEWVANGFGDLHDVKLPKAAPKLLGKLIRKAVKRGRKLEKAEPEAVHALRKSLKKVRYSVEFTVSALPGRRAQKLRKRAKSVLKPLGAFNDAVVAGHLAGELAEAEPGLRDGAMALAEWAGSHGRKSRETLPREWKRWRRRAEDWI